MKLNLLTLALIAVVGTAYAVPPKNVKVKNGKALKSATRTKAPHGDHIRISTPGRVRSLNEGYQPGI